MRLKFRYICIVHQTGVGYHNEVFQTVFAYKVVYRRQHRVPFIFVTFMDTIGKRIAAKANKQTEYNLRITVTSLLREACLAQFVVIIRFKVKYGDIIEQHTDIATEQFRSMAHTYVLYDFVLMVTKLVKIAVDF